MTRESTASAALAVAAMGLQVEVLVGAFFGAAFFMMLPFIEGLIRRAAMSFLSVGFGYFVGVAASPANAMWAASLGAALSVIVLTGATTYLSTANFSDILDKIITFVRLFK